MTQALFEVFTAILVILSIPFLSALLKSEPACEPAKRTPADAERVHTDLERS